jgi:hypothetical protein
VPARAKGRGSRWSGRRAAQRRRGAHGGDIRAVLWSQVAIPDEVPVAEGKWVTQHLLYGQLGDGSLEAWRR